ncbi:HD domain-containing protein [Rubeoparvulum massiliense]|uniref:HD domain-containing protein n=1 Tax=Rubeoparvulum massiliense TaxID=1631346 RepID=UPI00065E76B7|nr:HD domain-containing protein [Rubeoparvulum massiliense]
MNRPYKLFRDPVHGFIRVDRDFLAIIDTYAFQRLRRLSQLGTSYITYHGGEHTRFGHSLGVFHLFNKLADHFAEIGQPFNDEEILAGCCAALLHDIGHGPLSHTLEGLLGEYGRHEQWSMRIIQEDPELSGALRQFDPQLPEQVSAILAGTSSMKRVEMLISGQIDADRMDYLMRDSLFTGAMYGRFDYERLIEMLSFHHDELVVARKGLSTAEAYLMARYNMYWQVYLHRTTRGLECMLKSIWKRAQHLYREGQLREHQDVSSRFIPFLTGNVTVNEYLALDDTDIYVALKDFTNHSDPILADMADRILHRRLLKPVQLPSDYNPTATLEVNRLIHQYGYDPEYYLLFDQSSNIAYDYYIAGEEGGWKHNTIFTTNQYGEIVEISRQSDTIRAISHPRGGTTLFVPEECRQAVHTIYYGNQREGG